MLPAEMNEVPTTVHVEILPSEMAQIVEAVAQTMLKLELKTCDSPWFPDADRLTAVVHLTGVWNGAVLLECSRELACCFAARFLSIGLPKAVDEVVLDVLGELANMIGGNLKCVLTQGIGLSMPSVVNGSDYSLRVCGAEIQNRLSFQCDDGEFWVTILAMRASSLGIGKVIAEKQGSRRIADMS